MARGLSAVLAVLLVTVGCSTGQKGATPPPRLEPSATAAPTAVIPQAAPPTPYVSTADEAGAFAFVREYFMRLDRAYATGDTSSVRPLRADACVSCVQFERQIETSYRAGRLETQPLTIVRLGFGQSGPAFAKIGVEFRAAAVRSIRNDGSTSVSPATEGTYFVTLVRIQDHWIIDRLTGQVTQS